MRKWTTVIGHHDHDRVTHHVLTAQFFDRHRDVCVEPLHLAAVIRQIGPDLRCIR